MAFALTGKLPARPGKRAELAEAMLASVDAMPGCRLYLVSESETDPDTLWITEVWDDETAHRASLELPAVRETIQRAMPLIDMEGIEQVRMRPLGGHWPAGEWQD